MNVEVEHPCCSLFFKALSFIFLHVNRLFLASIGLRFQEASVAQDPERSRRGRREKEDAQWVPKRLGSLKRSEHELRGWFSWRCSGQNAHRNVSQQPIEDYLHLFLLETQATEALILSKHPQQKALLGGSMSSSSIRIQDESEPLRVSFALSGVLFNGLQGWVLHLLRSFIAGF